MSAHLDVITEEIATANQMLTELDDNIKQLQAHYARTVVIIDAFEKAQGIFDLQEELALEE
jgi:CBS-domain-containing membrane protein